MPSMIGFTAGAVLPVQAEPQTVLAAIHAASNGWTVLEDLAGDECHVFAGSVAWVRRITQRDLQGDPSLWAQLRNP